MRQRRIVVYEARERGGYTRNLDIAPDPFATALATSAANFDDVILELRVFTVASREQGSRLLLVQRIKNPEPNIPIQLDQVVGGLEGYMAPLAVSLRVVSGTAAKIHGGILTMRLRPRRQPGGGEQTDGGMTDGLV